MTTKQPSLCIFCGICLSLRVLVKVAAANRISLQGGCVYIMFGYNFNCILTGVSVDSTHGVFKVTHKENG